MTERFRRPARDKVPGSLVKSALKHAEYTRLSRASNAEGQRLENAFPASGDLAEGKENSNAAGTEAK